MNPISIIQKMTFGVVVILSALIFASCSGSSSPVNVNEDGVAIKGYDPVAYFDEGRPVKGKEEYSVEWNGAKWLFASEEHLELFTKDPEKFAPQYGGY